jgi:hypothetical protein
LLGKLFHKEKVHKISTNFWLNVNEKMFNEGNQIHNFMSSSGSGTVINYGSGSGSDFLTSYGSGYGSGSTGQKVTVPTVPVPVPQHCFSDVKTSKNLCVTVLPTFRVSNCTFLKLKDTQSMNTKNHEQLRI